MEVSGPTSIAAQEISTNKVQAGFDVLTKTLQKAEQNSLLKMEVAEQTGKGLHIDIKA